MAQKQSNYWYFGNYAALDFSSGTPVPLTNSAMEAGEGCATISDNSGNLLFYSNGKTVYGKNHQPLPNGNGLMGTLSSTQTALFVPQPLNSNLFFLFTVSELGGNMYCSLIDKSLNGGLGDIVTKNILLQTSVTEKLTAVSHCNGHDIWIVTHDLNTNFFYAYLVTSTGLQSLPVVSAAGKSVDNFGQMKLSPDGSFIATANTRSIFNMSSDYNLSKTLISISLFDNQNGCVHGAYEYIDQSYSSSPDGFYGLEFSPNSQLLYYGGAPGTYQSEILYDTKSQQLSLAAPFKIHSGGTGLQLANNGKIYLSNSDKSLASYDKPNKKGIACTFTPQSVVFSKSNSCNGSLPNFIQSYFNDRNYLICYDGSCHGFVTNFYISGASSTDSVVWNFDDVSSGVLNKAIGLNVSHLYTNKGLHRVIARVFNGGICDTVYKNVYIKSNVSPVDLFPNDTLLCNGETLYLLLKNPEAGTYKWQDGSTDGRYAVNSPGKYWLTYNSGCYTASDTVYINAIDCEPLLDSLPNVFTPNLDEINEVFCISPRNIKSMRYCIYNRWGNVIMCSGYDEETLEKETKLPNSKLILWNGLDEQGNHVNEGVYYYMLEIINHGNKKYNKGGFIQLLR